MVTNLEALWLLVLPVEGFWGAEIGDFLGVGILGEWHEHSADFFARHTSEALWDSWNPSQVWHVPDDLEGLAV